MSQVNTLTLFSLAAFVVLCWPCQTDAVCFGCTTQLLLSLSQRKVLAVVIIALITVGVAYCLLFVDVNVSVVFGVAAACFLPVSG